jgi:hypothetical protein
MNKRPLFLTIIAVYVFYVAASAFAGFAAGLMEDATALGRIGWVVPVLAMISCIRVGIDLLYVKARWRTVYLIALLVLFQCWRWWLALEAENRVVALVSLLNALFLAAALVFLFSKSAKAAYNATS